MDKRSVVLAAYPNACIRTYDAYTELGKISPRKRAYVVSIGPNADGPRCDVCTFSYFEHCFTEEDAWNDAAKAVEIEMIERLS